MKVSNLYIAQVKEECGIIERANYNEKHVSELDIDKLHDIEIKSSKERGEEEIEELRE